MSMTKDQEANISAAFLLIGSLLVVAGVTAAFGWPAGIITLGGGVVWAGLK